MYVQETGMTYFGGNLSISMEKGKVYFGGNMVPCAASGEIIFERVIRTPLEHTHYS